MEMLENLLSGLDLNDSITSVTNYRSVYVNKKNLNKIEGLMLKNKILSIPIIDKKKNYWYVCKNLKRKYFKYPYSSDGGWKRKTPITINQKYT